MPEGSSGILERLKSWKKGTTESRVNPVTTHRDAGMPLPAPEADESLTPNKLKQPGDDAAEMYQGDANTPGDEELMEERRARQQRRSDIVAEAASNGLPATLPVEPKGPQSTFKPPSES